MDFDPSKENIQPLRGGRNVSQLELALQANHNQDYQRELMQQREKFENAINTYTGEDPLDNWYSYVCWVEQSYPKHGHEGNLDELIEKCLEKFEYDERYTNDPRFCKLWIKYIDLQPQPIEFYQMMYSRGLCKGCADLYKAWAYYYEANGDFQNANVVFSYGIRELAQPYEELDAAHKNLIVLAGHYTLYGSDEKILAEKRQALTSLHTYKSGQVGSVREIQNNVVPMYPGPSATPISNSAIPIYTSEEDIQRTNMYAPLSIIAAAKRNDVPKENTLKPGPWSVVPIKKKAKCQRTMPAFTDSNTLECVEYNKLGINYAIQEDEEDGYVTVIVPYAQEVFERDEDDVMSDDKVHEDDDDDVAIIEDGEPIPCRNAVQNTVTSFPPECLENYSNWVTRMTLFEPKDDRQIPMYPKTKVYAEIHTEYSIEEVRSRMYKSRPLQVIPSETIQVFQPQMDFITQSPMKAECDLLPAYSIQSRPPIEIFDDDMMSVAPVTSQPRGGAKLRQSAAPNWNKTPQHLFMQPNDCQSNSNYDFWDSPTAETTAPVMVAPKTNGSKFSIYEQSNLGIEERVGPKGSAMKTPFKDLNAEELAETGSRGGMDVAAAAPVDSAKRLPAFDDDSSSPFDKAKEVNCADMSCNTQMFNFNLNAMKVSTPQNKGHNAAHIDSITDSARSTRKQLFSESIKPELVTEKVALSTILEETKSYGSSSSSGATTKSSLFSNNTKPVNMATISEHHSYLEQNLKANEQLRSKLGLLDFNTSPASNVILQQQQHQPEPPLPCATIDLSQSSDEEVFEEEDDDAPLATPVAVSPINFVPSDPFTPSLLQKLLARVGFPDARTRGYHHMNNTPRMVVRKEPYCFGPDRYVIDKQLGKGAFGTVFRGADLKTGLTKAVKFQKPANKWEFYICRELQSRLFNHDLRDRFMDIKLAYFNSQCSVYIYEFMPCGSLLDVANTVKQKSGHLMKEPLCVYFCLEMLRIVQAMHSVKIIHADIKPDNFLVLLLPDNSVGLQLIDFGCSIDMSLFPPNASFTRKIKTEDFVCCEMRDGRPWNYHTDLFCIAATTHVLLFDKYIGLQKKDGHWSITHRMQRYMRLDLWNMFFSSVLNQQSGLADTNQLIQMLDDSLRTRPDNFHSDMRYLQNLLKNR